MPNLICNYGIYQKKLNNEYDYDDTRLVGNCSIFFLEIFIKLLYTNSVEPDEPQMLISKAFQGVHSN